MENLPLVEREVNIIFAFYFRNPKSLLTVSLMPAVILLKMLLTDEVILSMAVAMELPSGYTFAEAEAVVVPTLTGLPSEFTSVAVTLISPSDFPVTVQVMVSAETV